MQVYQHYIQYYETDRMGITHHSNYIRFMEEARVSFLNKIGWNYAKLEAQGIISPVVAIKCKYLKPSTFADTLSIDVSVTKFSGVKLTLAYKMTNQDGVLICKGQSEHCFTTMDGKILRLNKDHPKFSQSLTALIVQED
ncbi:acyl-CoA thioesterase [Ligilactobacillus equi]|uniref:Uncharacterized protein n=1 Tax=Ligilactobacillus equi DPC 6820 TaxID=1392007 RepID=V7HW08_9LACO|nr:acyl-CoA thioesterase [Ligilactobacillus equi]ETA73373.1 hypothetical protein LEQ_1062c [Ligilactobacillus equi DPC 6820]